MDFRRILKLVALSLIWLLVEKVLRVASWFVHTVLGIVVHGWIALYKPVEDASDVAPEEDRQTVQMTVTNSCEQNSPNAEPNQMGNSVTTVQDESGSVPNENEPTDTVLPGSEAVQLQICRHCQDMLLAPSWEELGTTSCRGTLHPTTTTFLDAVKSGCLICKHLHRKLAGEHPDFDHVLSQIPADVDYHFSCERGKANEGGAGYKEGVLWIRLFTPLHLRSSTGKRQPPWIKEDMVYMGRQVRWKANAKLLITCTKDSDRKVNKVTVIPEIRDMPQRWPRIKEWIHDCINHHAECFGSFERQWTPSRLLDLGEQESSSLPRLVLAAECLPLVPYVTLSHCWGEIQPLRLLQSNLKEFCAGIPQPPRTFLEATYITKQIGIRYIWIDSLCIIQDSKDDWRSESAQMCDVYQHAFCNISALAAYNSSQGCFLTQHPWDAASWEFRLPMHTGEVVNYGVLDPDLIKDEFREAPLVSRAWVLQERLLAPRILYFGRHRAFFECHHHFTYEDNVMPDIDEDELKRLSRAESYDFHEDPVTTLKLGLTRTIDERFHGSANLEEVKRTLYRQWMSVVLRYCSCKITFEEDKLIALVGIAKRVQRVLNDEYLGGVWQQNAVREMTWTRDTQNMSRQRSYRAPTWSWASVNGAVKFQGVDPSLCVYSASVEAAQVERDGPDPIADQIVHASLCIRTKSCTSFMKNPDAVERSKSPDAMVDAGSFDEQGRPLWPPKASFDVISEGEQLHRKDLVFPVLQLYKNNGNHHYINGLVLVRDSMQSFRRVGTFETAVARESGLAAFMSLPAESFTIT